MAKVELSPERLIPTRPTLLIGANVNGKANFMAAAGGGVANGEPPMISVLIRRQGYTLKGVLQNMTFSVNIPSIDLVRETDFCGITTGANVDKVKVCKFDVFYGNLKSAPLIEQCPVNLECEVVHIMNSESHSFIIGQVKGTYVSDSCLTDGKPDVKKIKPIISNREALAYFSFGEVIGKSYSIGKELEVQE